MNGRKRDKVIRPDCALWSMKEWGAELIVDLIEMRAKGQRLSAGLDAVSAALHPHKWTLSFGQIGDKHER